MFLRPLLLAFGLSALVLSGCGDDAAPTPPGGTGGDGGGGAGGDGGTGGAAGAGGVCTPCTDGGAEDCEACWKAVLRCCYPFSERRYVVVEDVAAACAADDGCRVCCDECAALSCEELEARGACVGS